MDAVVLSLPLDLKCAKCEAPGATLAVTLPRTLHDGSLKAETKIECHACGNSVRFGDLAGTVTPE